MKAGARYPAVAILVAVALLLGGMPIVASQAAPDSRPAFTLDICHPLQAVNAASVPCNLPILHAQAIAHKPALVGILAEAIFTMATRPADAPDPPPPKTPA